MIRLRVFGRCAVYRDPITPVVQHPSRIGWKGVFREIHTVIERQWTGSELLRRMEGWFTVDPDRIIQVIEASHPLQVTPQGDLVVEFAGVEEMERLKGRLRIDFGDEVQLRP